MPGRATAPVPDGELDDVAVDRDPLGLRAGGDDVAVGARAELDADGEAVGQPEGEVERRGVVRGIREPTRRAPGRRAAGRVEPGAVDAAEATRPRRVRAARATLGNGARL